MKKSLKLTNYQQLLKGIFILCTIFSHLDSKSQSTTSGLGNSPGVPGVDFLGWNNTVNSTLEIRHDTPNQPIIFRTSGLERMRIKPDARISINTTSSLGGSRFTVLQKEVISAKRILEINHELVEIISA